MAKHSRFGKKDGRLVAMRNADYPGGVAVDPVPITENEEVTILYNGLLAKPGVENVYLHYGFGHADAWDDIRELRMEKTDRGYAKRFEVNNSNRLNFCFRDSSGNWDNNKGVNWSFGVHGGKKI